MVFYKPLFAYTILHIKIDFYVFWYDKNTDTRTLDYTYGLGMEFADFQKHLQYFSLNSIQQNRTKRPILMSIVLIPDTTFGAQR